VAAGDVAGGKRTAADLGAWLIFEDESGQGLRPPKGRTWGRRGATPVVKVTGAHNTRVSLAALIAVKPGCRPRLIYRVHRSRRQGTDRRKGFTETDYARLLDAAHQQLGGPLVVVWDNLNTHVSAAMAELIAARDWRSFPVRHTLIELSFAYWTHGVGQDAMGATTSRAGGRHGRDGSWWAWVPWVHETGGRRNHKVVLVRADSLRPLEPPAAYKAVPHRVRGLYGQIRSR
jgi:DDE superfamily endonuclease